MNGQRVVDISQLIDVPDKTLLEEAMELQKVKEERVPSMEKTKFERKAIEYMESMSSEDEIIDSKA